MGDAAPRTARKAAGAKKAAGPARRPGAPSKDDKLKEALTQLYAGIATAASPVMGMAGYSEDQRNAAAAVIAMSAESCAESWVQLAKTNEAVRSFLEKMTEAGGWGTVVTVHIGLGMGVYAAVKATAPEPAEIPEDTEPPAPARVAPENVDDL